VSKLITVTLILWALWKFYDYDYITQQ